MTPITKNGVRFTIHHTGGGTHRKKRARGGRIWQFILQHLPKTGKRAAKKRQGTLRRRTYDMPHKSAIVSAAYIGGY